MQDNIGTRTSTRIYAGRRFSLFPRVLVPFVNRLPTRAISTSLVFSSVYEWHIYFNVNDLGHKVSRKQQRQSRVRDTLLTRQVLLLHDSNRITNPMSFILLYLKYFRVVVVLTIISPRLGILGPRVWTWNLGRIFVCVSHEMRSQGSSHSGILWR